MAKDCYDRTRRWVSEVNTKGSGREYYSAEMVALAPPEKAGYLPMDRLQLDVERHEHIYNPDPLGSANRDPGVVFYACTDFRQAVANFDLQPFVEGFVRRLSIDVPGYLWRVGPKFFDRGIGVAFDPHQRAFQPRRWPVPKAVVEAFGPVRQIMVHRCQICNTEDDRVVQQPSDKITHAHYECYLQGGPAQ